MGTTPLPCLGKCSLSDWSPRHMDSSRGFVLLWLLCRMRDRVLSLCVVVKTSKQGLTVVSPLQVVLQGKLLQVCVTPQPLSLVKGGQGCVMLLSPLPTTPLPILPSQSKYAVLPVSHPDWMSDDAPAWNLRSAIWFLFPISIVLLPLVLLLFLSCHFSAYGPLCIPFFQELSNIFHQELGCFGMTGWAAGGW